MKRRGLGSSAVLAVAWALGASGFLSAGLASAFVASGFAASAFTSGFFSSGFLSAGFLSVAGASALILSANFLGSFWNSSGHLSQQKPMVLPSKARTFGSTTGLPLT